MRRRQVGLFHVVLRGPKLGAGCKGETRAPSKYRDPWMANAGIRVRKPEAVTKQKAQLDRNSHPGRLAALSGRATVQTLHTA